MLFDEGPDNAVTAAEALGDDLTMQKLGFEAAAVDPTDQVGLERV
ncbi:MULTISPECIES: hypothetical protein [unclassified Actinoplanes]|nr:MULTISPECIES: hypothetical protein [unclassified Actinoplanes]